jgi:hypothetical protein
MSTLRYIAIVISVNKSLKKPKGDSEADSQIYIYCVVVLIKVWRHQKGNQKPQC